MDRLVSLNSSLNPKEYSSIVSILSNYSIVPDKIERKRSVYKVTAGDKVYCLKKTQKGDNKAKKGMYLVSYLKERGFNNIAEYIKSNDGKEYVKSKRGIYYLTEWIDGKECDLDNIEDLKSAAKLLARFHMASTGFNPSGVKIESNLKNWPLLFLGYKHDLDTYKLFIEKKKVQTTFDLEYYNHINDYKEYMEKSIELLRKSNYISISKKSREIRSLCHDSFYYQNIIKSTSNELYLIDLDSTIYDIHVYDLAKFIRRILYKKVYAWEFDVARELIEAYTTVKELSLEEYEILLAFIIFPQKYWKLGRKRYVKRKRWSEEKYRRRLHRIVKYADKQRVFIDNFMNHYKINV